MIEAAGERGRGASARSVFSECPVALWEEDVTELLAHLGRLRAEGASDLRGLLERHPGELRRCAGLIRVVAVNRAALALYDAPDEQRLLAGLPEVFTDESLPTFREFVLALAEGRTRCAAEGVNRTLRGRRIDVELTWSLLSDGGGSARVLLSVIDRTEQRRLAAELLDAAARGTEEAARLRESQRTLETVIETAPS